jgi:hypothetical protein
MIEPIYDNHTMTLEHIERQVIINRLAFFNGSKPLAAKSLGVSEKTIYNKLEEYEKNAPPKESAETKKAREDAFLARQRGQVPTVETAKPSADGTIETSEPMTHPQVLNPGATAPTPPPAPAVQAPVVRLPTPAAAPKATAKTRG